MSKDKAPSVQRFTIDAYDNDNNGPCVWYDDYAALEAKLAELMPQVQMLVGALEEITKPYKDFGLGCFHEEIARHALTEWQEYVGD
jgi:hypothetical protein